MKKNQILLSLAVITSILFMSCKKDNKMPSIEYQLKRSSTSSAPINARILGGSVEFTSGYASVNEIEFEAEKENTELEYKSETRKKIDLFSPISSLGILTVPAGVYDDVEFEVEVQPNGTDAAFQLNGSFTNGNAVVTPIVFTVNTPLEIESEQSKVTIVDGASLTAFTK